MGRPKNIDAEGKRQCTTCKKFKPEDAFYKKRGYKGARYCSPSCKACIRPHNNERYRQQRKNYYENHKGEILAGQKSRTARNRDFLWEWFIVHPCTDCGETNPVLLEADHVRGLKREGLSVMTQSPFSLQSIQEELDKCESVCANCHRIRTARRSSSEWLSRWDDMNV